MQYINVQGGAGLVRDLKTSAVLNTNKNEIEAARRRKLLSKEKDKEFEGMQEDIKTLKGDMSDIKALLTRMVEKNG